MGESRARVARACRVARARERERQVVDAGGVAEREAARGRAAPARGRAAPERRLVERALGMRARLDRGAGRQRVGRGTQRRVGRPRRRRRDRRGAGAARSAAQTRRRPPGFARRADGRRCGRLPGSRCRRRGARSDGRSPAGGRGQHVLLGQAVGQRPRRSGSSPATCAQRPQRRAGLDDADRPRERDRILAVTPDPRQHAARDALGVELGRRRPRRRRRASTSISRTRNGMPPVAAWQRSASAASAAPSRSATIVATAVRRQRGRAQRSSPAGRRAGSPGRDAPGAGRSAITSRIPSSAACCAEVGQHVERRVVGPVRVVDRQHQRSPVAERVDEPPEAVQDVRAVLGARRRRPARRPAPAPRSWPSRRAASAAPPRRRSAGRNSCRATPKAAA